MQQLKTMDEKYTQQYKQISEASAEAKEKEQNERYTAVPLN